jgi:hypothetical protein
MNKKLIYIGLDVDDTQYHGAAFDRQSGKSERREIGKPT